VTVVSRRVKKKTKKKKGREVVVSTTRVSPSQCPRIADTRFLVRIRGGRRFGETFLKPTILLNKQRHIFFLHDDLNRVGEPIAPCGPKGRHAPYNRRPLRMGVCPIAFKNPTRYKAKSRSFLRARPELTRHILTLPERRSVRVSPRVFSGGNPRRLYGRAGLFSQVRAGAGFVREISESRQGSHLQGLNVFVHGSSLLSIVSTRSLWLKDVASFSLNDLGYCSLPSRLWQAARPE